MTREELILQWAAKQARQLEETLEEFERMVGEYEATMQRVCAPLHGPFGADTSEGE